MKLTSFIKRKKHIFKGILKIYLVTLKEVKQIQHWKMLFMENMQVWSFPLALPPTSTITALGMLLYMPMHILFSIPYTPAVREFA